jgi:cellulose synthase/poly-beta-1,6-N-acetylglucosamine synthase-like glycosyltransferase
MSALVTVSYGLAALFSAAFGVMELRMLARFLRHRAEIRGGAEKWRENGTPDGDGPAWPTVTIQLPLFNERTSAEQIIRAAGSQEYPRDRFDIQVLDDSTDETSAIVARVSDELRATGVRIEHLRRPERVGYKAGALADGLTRSTSEFVAVFDADFAPRMRFLDEVLREARPFADTRVAFAQARWTWHHAEHDGWLRRVLALLLERHFRIQKPIREHLGNVTTFNGSGGVWRRTAIDDAGGWTSDTLTEDLDLSYRCALAGWRGRYLQDVEVLNQLPGHMRAFKLQQRRWSKGTTQCLRKLLGRVFGSGDVKDRFEEAFLLAGYVIHPLLLVSLVLWPWAVLYMDRTVFWVLQALMALGVVAAAVSFLFTVRERDGGWSKRGIGEAVAGIAIGVGLLVNNTVGQIQGLFSEGGEFLRTPKLATPSAMPTKKSREGENVRGYTTPLHWTFFLELAVVAYCAFGAAVLVQNGEGLWAVAMAFWGASVGLVAMQQLAPERT